MSSFYSECLGCSLLPLLMASGCTECIHVCVPGYMKACVLVYVWCVHILLCELEERKSLVEPVSRCRITPL